MGDEARRRRISLYDARRGDVVYFKSGPRKVLGRYSYQRGLVFRQIRDSKIGGGGSFTKVFADGKRTTCYLWSDLSQMGARYAVRLG